MNVVVSAIVDPWVTTFSFVVALAMRIQGQKLQILCRNQAQPERTARLARNPSRRNIHAQKNTHQQVINLLVGTFLTH